MFHVPRVNVIGSDEGFSVEVLGRTGLRYVEGPKSIFVDSEVLAPTSLAGLAVYRDRMRWEPPESEDEVDAATRERVVDNIRRAFRFRGLEVEVS